MLKCILEWLSVMYHLQVTVTLPSDLVFRRLFSKQISYMFEGRNLKFGVWVPL